MERKNLRPFFSPASAERRLLPTCRNRGSSEMMSPTSQVTAESSCSSRIIGPFNGENFAHEPGSRSRHFVARPCNRGSIQAKLHTRHTMNTSLPHHVRHSQNNSILSPLSASLYDSHSTSCPVKAVPHPGSRDRNVLTPKLMYLKDTVSGARHSVSGRPSNLVVDQVRHGQQSHHHHQSSGIDTSAISVRGMRGNRHTDQLFGARHPVRHRSSTDVLHRNSTEGFHRNTTEGFHRNTTEGFHRNTTEGFHRNTTEGLTIRNVLVHDRSKAVQGNLRVEFSDEESVQLEDSMSCIQNQIGSIILSHDWDRDNSVNKMTRMGLQKPSHVLLRPDISGESLLRGADNFRDSSTQEVDLTAVKDEPCSDEDVRTLGSPPNHVTKGASPQRRNLSVRENIGYNHVSLLNSSGGLIEKQVPSEPTKPTSEERIISENEATVVENWTIKYSRGKSASTTRIVGFPKGCNKIWKSSVIEERISRDMLLTASGKTYRLHGPLDAVTSKNLGLSDAIITTFKNGFPEDWKSILEGWAESSDSEEEKEEEDDIHYFDEEKEDGADLSIQSEDDGLDVRPVSIPVSIPKSNMAANRQKEQKSKTKLPETKSGNKHNSDEQRNEIQEKRKPGHPKKIMPSGKSKNCEIPNKSMKKIDKNSATKEKSEEKSSSSKNVNKTKRTLDASKEKRGDEDNKKSNKNNSESVAVKTRNPAKNKTPLWKTSSNGASQQESEKPLSIERLPRTLSGRRVKPVLAWWAGQRVFCNDDVVEIVCEASKEALKKENVSILNFEVTPRGKAFFSRNSAKNFSSNTKKRSKKLEPLEGSVKNEERSQTLNTTEDDAEQDGDAEAAAEAAAEATSQSLQTDRKSKQKHSKTFVEEHDTQSDSSIQRSPEKSKRIVEIKSLKKGEDIQENKRPSSPSKNIRRKELDKESSKKSEKTVDIEDTKSRKRLGTTGRTVKQKEKELDETFFKEEVSENDTNLSGTASESEEQDKPIIEEQLKKSKRRTSSRIKGGFSSQESLLSTDDSFIMQSRSPVKLSRETRRKYREQKWRDNDTNVVMEAMVPDLPQSRSSVKRRLSRSLAENEQTVRDDLTSKTTDHKNDQSPTRFKGSDTSVKAALKSCNVSLVKLSGNSSGVSKDKIRRSTRKRRRMSQSSQDDSDFQASTRSTRSKKAINKRKRIRRNVSYFEEEDYQFSD